MFAVKSGQISHMHNLSLAQKVGQMIMIGFEGIQSTEPECRIIIEQLSKGALGGVILFKYNIENPKQLRALTKSFHQENLSTLIAVDQEGGLVQRLSAQNGFTDYLSPKQVVATKSPSEACNYYQTMAAELSTAGINLNFAHSIDLDANCPVIGQLERSFSNNPQVIAEYATALIKAHHTSNVLTCVKHYPGHGLAQKDSHCGMVDITDTYQSIENEPFKQLINENKVDTVMTAHLVNRNFDPDYPCTMSYTMIEQTLRTQNQFKGVVITDDLHMGAIQQHYNLEEIVIKAINAGNDILLFSNNPNAAKGVVNFQRDIHINQKVIAIVEKAIANGTIVEQRIDESYERICKLKSKLQ